MKQKFTFLFLWTAFIIGAPNVALAQDELSNLKKVENNPFKTPIDLSDKENNVQLPAYKLQKLAEKSKFKPGKAPAYVPQQEEIDHPLTFVGMLNAAFTPDGNVYTPYGFYKFSSENGFKREEYVDVGYIINMGGDYGRNKLSGVSSIEYRAQINQSDGKQYIVQWDTDTWQPTGLHETWADQSLSGEKAYDPITDAMYLFNRQGSAGSLYCELDMSDFSIKRTILSTDSVIEAFAINADGEGYVITENSSLCKLDVPTGEMTYIGKLDFEAYLTFPGLAFDHRTGKLYLCCNEADWDEETLTTRLCEVNLEDATTRVIAFLPDAEEYTCLRLLYTPTDECPAAITDLEVGFEQMSLNGFVNFTMPSANVGGGSLTGNIKYTISVNDEDIIEGEASAGEKVTESFRDPNEDGMRKVVVVLENEAGESVRNVALTCKGPDTPMPHDAILTYESGMAKVTWTVAGEYGGNISDGDITYDVVRYPGAVQVATGLEGTSFSENMEDAGYAGYYYEIIPMLNGEQGKAAKTNVVKFGQAYEVPYTLVIDSYDVENSLEIIDADNDGATWSVYRSTLGNDLYEFSLCKTTNYSSSDDWVILPPLKFRAGKSYSVSFEMQGAPLPTERLFVAFGEGLDVSTYETVLEVKVNAAGWHENIANIKVDKDGEYRVGFHDCTERGAMLRNITVTEDIATQAPGSVTNLTVDVAGGGDLAATISFTAPTTTFDGGELTSISKIEIWRGEELATTIDNPEPGEDITYVDYDAINGYNTYRVMAYNEHGVGVTATCTAYIGEGVPLDPTDVKVIDNLDGTATLTWTIPERGVDDAWIDQDAILSNIYTVTAEDGVVLMAEGVSERSYRIDNLPQSEGQQILYYGVESYNEAGKTNIVQANFLVGTPFGLPFMENFLMGKLAGLWYVDSSNYDEIFNMYTGMSADGDNCVTGFASLTPGNWSALHSGKISVASASRPMLVFAYFNQPGIDNSLEVLVRENGGAEEDVVFSKDFVDETSPSGWCYAKIDLSDYKGSEYISVSFKATINNTSDPMVVIDDVNIRDVRDNDLTVYANVQKHVTAGDNAYVTATVHNVGDLTASEWYVSLYVNDKQVATYEGDELPSFQRQVCEMYYPTKLSDPEQSSVNVEVVYANDDDNNNNVSDKETMSVCAKLLNRVDDLKGEVVNKQVTLTWTGVSEENVVTDSFEGYASFMTEGFGDWLTVDADGESTPLISGLNFPGQGEPFAFITFDFDAAGADLSYNPSLAGNSGTQMLACLPASQGNSDWLISPELSGKEQTVSFYLKVLNGMGFDEVDVYYSTTGRMTADFTNKVETVTNIPGSFTEYRYDLPEGAKYFAIRCCTPYNGGILLIDDITYEGKPLTLTGYNIYRDGKLVGNVDANTTSFTDDAVGAKYNVTAVYEEGESGYSNDYIPDSSIESVSTDESGEERYYDLSGRRIEEPQRGVTIMEKNGKAEKIFTKW